MWQAPKNETKTFDPHPTGPYVARICDQWEVEQENPYFGSTNPDGKVDERRTVTNVCIAMLTAESIEIDGQLRPRWVSFWASKSWHEKSNLRKFVAGFDPSFAANDQADPEELIGKVVMVNIVHHTKKDGTIRAKVAAAMPAPKGMEHLAPSLDGYVRHADKQQ